MDKKIAQSIADKKVQEIILEGGTRIMDLLKESERDRITEDGVTYQLSTHAFYDDKVKRVIRVVTNVDDVTFWSTFMPVSRSDLITVDKKFYSKKRIH